jgi:hypothetical protein
MSKSLPIKSSWLTHTHYDAKTKTCTVEMKSGTYRGEISPAQWKAFEATFQVEESSGKHFNSHLRKLRAKRL